MFYIPFLLGILVGGRFNGAVLVLLVAASALFISRESLLIVWRSRGRGRVNAAAVRLLSIYLGLALGGGLLLLLHYRLTALLWLGLPGLGLLLLNGRQAAQREDRTIPSEIMAICGMTLSAPAAHYAATGYWTATTWWLWLFSILYFTSSVFYVRFRVTSHHGRDPLYQERIARALLVYHLLLPAIGWLPNFPAWSTWALLAFLPVVGRAIYHYHGHYHRPRATLNLRQIGMHEIWYSLIFLVFATLAFR
jgi:hypothetical protein